MGLINLRTQNCGFTKPIRLPWLPAFLVVAGMTFACGEQAVPFDGLVTVVRVEEKLADGSAVPVPNADIRIKLYAKSNASADAPLIQEFTDTTDANGLSAVMRGAAGKTDAEISTVFVEVDLPDGRTGFNRTKLETQFDFRDWLAKISADSPSPKSIIEKICSNAAEFPDCKKVLESRNLVTWGAGVVVTIRPT